ncbi:hypothetical protein ACTHSM_02495 [Neisseria sp. P0009.S001]|jgi:hypothetical protein|uniref:hypothetical protein n=2 Tax=Neisseriaceae TaxID=481 RepID=UPI0001C34AEF|nr:MULTISPECIES: hypothetical protein [Neisseria]MBF1298203.1 hypothetical protein [Neisseria sp.]MCL5079134.1 hypothetical protein [Neisseria perflava]MDU5726802.1 hypothetical protein [Neisseria sp.]MDU6148515.1 hypothetical protein [Neisseria subflava]OFK04649.1 hypothetical protein HMPREF2834_04780 [Neisseria sp. HMSC067H04]
MMDNSENKRTFSGSDKFAKPNDLSKLLSAFLERRADYATICLCAPYLFRRPKKAAIPFSTAKAALVIKN